MEEVGEPRVECESEGECLMRRDGLLLGPLPPDKLAMEVAIRGLPVPARERCPGWKAPVAW